MPFINVKIIGEPLRPDQVGRIQRDITGLMADVLHKVGPLVGVLVEQVAPGSWSIGGAAVTHAVQVDAIVSAGSNSAEQKARFIAEAQALLRSVLGPDLAEVTYIVIHDVPKDSWGYGGLTQAQRAKDRQAA